MVARQSRSRRDSNWLAKKCSPIPVRLIHQFLHPRRPGCRRVGTSRLQRQSRPIRPQRRLQLTRDDEAIQHSQRCRRQAEEQAREAAIAKAKEELAAYEQELASKLVQLEKEKGEKTVKLEAELREFEKTLDPKLAGSLAPRT